MEHKRIVYFDYLRVISTIAVVVLHVAAQNWKDVDVQSTQWAVMNVYDSLVRWAVPVFVMISGALFLSKELSVERILKKNVSHLAIIYVLWSAFYAVSGILGEYVFRNGDPITLKAVIRETIVGEYHMWFIPMIIGLYLCTPILKQLVRNRKMAEYFLVLSLFFTVLFPWCVHLVEDFVGGPIASGVGYLDQLMNTMQMDFVLGYAFYFVLGHWLHQKQLTRKQCSVIYLLGIAGALSTILLTMWISYKTMQGLQTYYGNFSVNVFVQALAIFVWFKQRPLKNEKANRVAAVLSKYSFGVYLSHAFVIWVFMAVGLNTLSFSPIISIPVLVICIFAGSLLISYILNKIPFVNRWIV